MIRWYAARRWVALMARGWRVLACETRRGVPGGWLMRRA
jgi:hypothetical protein